MKEDGSLSPTVIVCTIGLLLVTVFGMAVESSVGKEDPLWSISVSLLMLPLMIIAIHFIVTKRAFYKRHEATGVPAVVFGSILLLVFGSVFVCMVLEALRQLEMLP
jgi:cell division protein FtsW (lipid II flippase)